MTKFRGTGVALVTPFNKDLSIDFEGLKRLLAHVSEGVEYLVVQGTTGESPTTSAKEKKEIFAFVKDNNSRKLPIVFGAGGNNTHQIIDTIKDTDLNGVDAILSVSPYYNKPGQASIIRHYEMLADASPLPIILYNVPGRTSSNLRAETTLRLAEHENILGIKEASGDMTQITEIALNKDEDFLLISGDDMLTVPMISLGAIGVISVIANAFPMQFGNMIRMSLNGKFDHIRREFKYLNDINPLLYHESNPVGIKQVLKEMGIIEPWCRPPLWEASKELARAIATAIKK